MIGPGEVDDDLEFEIREEMAKYGDVANVLIFEVSLWVLILILVRCFLGA